MTRTRLGMLTPSSNTVLEPATARMLAALPDVTAHFGRFRVLRIALDDTALRQFDPAPIVEAATLLHDAHMHVMAWNGTSAGWLGFDSDTRLCAALTAATGVPATSSVLAVNAALACIGAARIGLVTPYTADVQARICANYAAAGHTVVAERHLDDPGNFSFATHEEPVIASMIRDVAAARPDAMVTLCTNMRAPGVVAALETETGIPIRDSIAAVLWHALALASIDPARVTGWGSVFQLRV